jgi:hypothetical protein
MPRTIYYRAGGDLMEFRHLATFRAVARCPGVTTPLVVRDTHRPERRDDDHPVDVPVKRAGADSIDLVGACVPARQPQMSAPRMLPPAPFPC